MKVWKRIFSFYKMFTWEHAILTNVLILIKEFQADEKDEGFLPCFRFGGEEFCFYCFYLCSFWFKGWFWYEDNFFTFVFMSGRKRILGENFFRKFWEYCYHFWPKIWDCSWRVNLFSNPLNFELRRSILLKFFNQNVFGLNLTFYTVKQA